MSGLIDLTLKWVRREDGDLKDVGVEVYAGGERPLFTKLELGKPVSLYLDDDGKEESKMPVEWQINTDGTPVKVGPKERANAFAWANEQIPEGDLDVKVMLANWVLTGEYK